MISSPRIGLRRGTGRKQIIDALDDNSVLAEPDELFDRPHAGLKPRFFSLIRIELGKLFGTKVLCQHVPRERFAIADRSE